MLENLIKKIRISKNHSAAHGVLSRRTLAAALCVCIMISFLPAEALAAEFAAENAGQTPVNTVSAEPASAEPTPAEPAPAEPTPVEPVCTCGAVTTADGVIVHGNPCPLYQAPLTCAKTPGCTLIEAHEGDCVAAPGDAVSPLTATPRGLVPFTGALDLANGSIIVSAAGYTQSGAAEVPYAGAYTITQTGDATTKNTITVTGGIQTITLSGVSIDVSTGANTGETPCAFSVLGGDVTLLLADGSSNTLVSGYTVEGAVAYGTVSGYAGLWVRRGALLTIGNHNSHSSGILSATGSGTGSFGGAGIGGSYIKSGAEGAMGNITINGGTITAVGAIASRVGAGIGKATGDTYADATITINGGDVTATGHGQAAGIGGAYSAPNGHVVINGGTVTATAKARGAGMGAGDITQFGSVTITGGTVTAQAAGDCAGIGGCGSDQYMTCNGCPVTISGGTVTATGSGYGAGIGGGGYSIAAPETTYGGGSSSDITISGGIVTATGGAYGAGIGSGSRKDAKADQKATNGGLGTIRITDGNVKAVNGSGFSGSNYSPGGVPTGIGQGSNPGSGAAASFAAWNVLTDQNAKILTQKTLAGQTAPVTVLCNGASWATVAPNDQSEIYLWLPEGYYKIGDGALELVAATADKTAAATLIGQLNAVDLTAITITQKDMIAGYETAYLALSKTLQYYVDEMVNPGHTIAAIKAALDSSMSGTPMEVTLELAGGNGATSATVNYGQAVALPIPTKTNYTFGGWFIGSAKVTEPDGTGTPWTYLSAQTLTAHWVSEITGTGKLGDPYLLKSAENFLALSRVSFGTNTAEELALFGATAKQSDVLAAHFQLVKPVTLRTADGFYGINGFGGTFDGGYNSEAGTGPAITLAIDTSNKIFTDPQNPNAPTNLNEGKVNVGTAEAPQYATISAALFMNLPSGVTLKNIHTAGTVTLVTKESTMALLAADLNGGSTISGCLNEASFEAGATYNTAWTGVMVGQIRGAGNVIEHCVNRGSARAGTVSVSQGNASAAGIAGFNSGSDTIIRSCHNYGDIYVKLNKQLTTRSANAAGICSYNSAASRSITFDGCTNHGKVWADNTAYNQAAGICTYSTAKATYRNCKNYGEVISNSGIAGAISGHFTKNAVHSETTYTDCYQVLTAGEGKETWKLSDSSAAVSSGTLSVPITNEDENYFNPARHVVDGTGAKVADLYSADSTHLYADLTHNGNLLSQDYPFQSWADAYTIANYTDYLNLAKAIAGDAAAQTAVLGNRLAGADVTSKSVALTFAYVKVTAPFTMGDGYVGIGTPGMPFVGKVDGGGHTVTYALNYPALAENGTTEFGFVACSGVGAELKNLNFDGSISIITVPENGKAFNIGSVLASGDAVISDCRSATAITAMQNFNVQGGNATGAFVYGGGLVGSFISGAITNCTNSGTISIASPKNPYAGGIAGAANGAVTACHNSGAVTSALTYREKLNLFGENSYAGGITATATTVTLEGCTNTAPVVATNDCVLTGYFANAGGLVASAATLTLTNCGAYGTVSATGKQGGATARRGGLCGSVTTLTASGTNDYLKTGADFYGAFGTASDDAAIHPIDVTGLTGTVTFGDTVALCSSPLPPSLAISSTIAALGEDGKTLTFTKAGTGTVSLTWETHPVYTSGTITVSQKDITASATISGVSDPYLYTGSAIIPVPTVKYGDTVLIDGTDYEVTYSNNINVGTAGITVAFQGNYSSGSKSAAFTITPKALTVTAKSYSVNVGGAAPATYEYTVTGLVGSDGLLTPPTVACPTADCTKVGSYLITIGGATASPNYAITHVSGNLTVAHYSDSYDSSNSIPKPESPKTDPVTGNTEISIPVKPVTNGGTSSATVPEKAVNDAIAAATKEAEKTGGRATVTVSVDAPEGAKTVETTLPSKSLAAVADGKPEGLKISTPVANVSFNTKALTAIASAAGKDVKISITQVDRENLTGTQKEQVGDAPVFDFTITSDGKIISAFGGGTATITVPYTLKEGENPEFITVWLLDDAGKLVPIEAKYANGEITFTTGHFSRYAISYLPFTDVNAGWSYESIVYAYQNKLFSGVGNDKFAPAYNMNRAMFWSVLYRMAGSPAKTDAPPTWYTDARQWAIASGISDGTNPTGNVTREQMATILYYYAKATATTTDMSTFTDTNEISAFAKDGMTWAVANGILSGNGGKLNPKGNATRAEVAAMLQRFAGIIK